MAVPGSRMRLTVVVESLAEENAHGEYRELALEAFKERKFAMPVQLEDTFETVWNEIEQRYKTNYLDAQQAAAFSIKKLQDAYDCDLDMTDTVGAIFEGEPDRKMHMIKVVPHFIYRETSVVPGSKLRPSGAQKRLGDDIDNSANKRRRVELQQQLGAQETRELSPNRPIASTESQHTTAEGIERAGTDERAVRSRSGISLLELGRIETGQVPFSSTGLKQESPDPEPLLDLHGIDTASRQESTKQQVDAAPEEQSRNPQHSPSRTNLSHERVFHTPLRASDNEVTSEIEAAGGITNGYTEVRPEHAASLQFDSQESAINNSPVSSVDAEPTPAPTSATSKRKDVYQLPSSPDFMHKKGTPEKHAKTYGRSPRSTQVIRKEVDLLNMARRLSRNAKEKGMSQEGPPVSVSKKARVFQRPQPDEIESTPQDENRSGLQEGSHVTSDDENEDADLTASFLKETADDELNDSHTPARKPPVKSMRSGNLKKPSLATLPASTRRGAKSKVDATPVPGVQVNEPSTKSVTTTTTKTKTAMTPSTGGFSKSGKALSHQTTSRMEHLQKLLSASQSTPKRRADTNSPVQTGSIESRGQDNRPFTEAQIPGQMKAESVDLNRKVSNPQPNLQPPTMQKTPVKSPVPLPSSIRKSTPASLVKSKSVTETPKVDAFKKPVVRVRESPVPLPSTRRSSHAMATGTPRRSEIPLPPNVRDLRRSSSLHSSPLANGDSEKGKSSPITSVATAKLNKVPSDAVETCAEPPIAKLDVTDESARGTNPTHDADAIVISSAESSSSNDSDSEKEQRRDLTKHEMDKTIKRTSISTATNVFTEEAEPLHANASADVETTAKKGIGQPKETRRSNNPVSTQLSLPQTQEKPPSGQGSTQAASWANESWGFGGLEQAKNISDKPGQASEPEFRTVAPVASASDDEGFAEPETYNTAVEDNVSRSRSISAAASIRSSPTVLRRPARFLSHSPTPDASESEDDSEEISFAHSQAASPHTNDKEESQSDSESSSDSSEEEVEVPGLLAESMANSNANAAPPPSPPLDTFASSTSVVPQTSQSTPSQASRPTQRTPVPLPTLESSQALRSSQSASVQRADRRRYTGFRSLREQLADTKAAQATTQTNTFDPRTMSLGKLAKGKPLISFGGDDESSEDESSSSSSSDSD